MSLLVETFYTVVEWPIPTHIINYFMDFHDEGFRYGQPPSQLRCSMPLLISRDGVNNALGGGDPCFASRVAGPHADCRIVAVKLSVSAPIELVEIPPTPPAPKFRLPGDPSCVNSSTSPTSTPGK